MYQVRTYRNFVKGEGLVKFQAHIDETDLLILAEKNLSKAALSIVKQLRSQLKTYFKNRSEFATSTKPIDHDIFAPHIVQLMLSAASETGVGPMACVSGAIAQLTGEHLLKYTNEIIVENGGDIFIKTKRIRTVSIFAGNSPLSGRIGLVINPDTGPIGVCTSSGTIGHSFSYGKADAAVVVSKSSILADAGATALCNRIVTEYDINNGIDYIKSVEGINGAIAIKNKKMVVWGNIEICTLD